MSEADLKRQVWTLVGVTGWSLAQVMRLTLPQLEFFLEGCGPMLWPRLKPALDHHFSKLSSRPGPKGEESDIRRIIREHAERLRGEASAPTAEAEERARAYRILHAYYLGETEERAPEAEPLAGVSPQAARAILAYGAAGKFPEDIWARDVAGYVRALRATANSSGRERRC